MVDHTPLIPAEPDYGGRKLGHKICCCCCDSKRAVQFLNSVGVIINVVMLVLLSVNRYSNVIIEGAEDEVRELRNNYTYYMIVYSIGLGINLIVLCGASTYNRFLVLFGVVYTLYELGNYVYFGITDGKEEAGWWFTYIILPSLWTGLYIYPHGVFIKEVGDGIMAPETYARERFSCCCV